MGELTFGPAVWALTLIGAAAAAIYGLLYLNKPPTLVRALVKTAFMGALAAALIVAGAPFPLAAALIASALGDFFLAFDKKWLLPLGILSFLIAQLAYFVIFAAVWAFSGDNSPLAPRYTAMGCILLLAIAFLVWLWRDDLKRAPVSGSLAIFALFATGLLLPIYVAVAGLPGAALRLLDVFTALVSGGPEAGIASPSEPILAPFALLVLALCLAAIRRDLGVTRLGAMIYAGMITAMALMAMWVPWVGWPAMLGAGSFLVSDFVLAAELFRLAPDSPLRKVTAPVVWWTYVAAQLLIVAGIVSLILARA